jgi:hypothetical protein
MLDHVFAQLVASLRRAYEGALLQRQAVEERFQVDVFLGDVSFETSYSLPGESRPARIRVDTSLDWPTWSQAAYRSRTMGDEPEEQPEVLVEIAFRVQGLASRPDVAPLLDVLPGSLSLQRAEALHRGPATIEQVLLATGAGDGDGEAGDPTADDVGDSSGGEWAVEVSYEGSWPFDEQILDDPATLDPLLAPLGREVASVLVRIADLAYEFRPVADGGA